jgi:cell cycle arrest protein BUB2
MEDADVELRRQYEALLAGTALTADYERWRELKRLVVVHGLPRDEGVLAVDGASCSLRGRVWKALLGVESDVDMTKYAALVGRGASHYDGDIRNDTFRTFRGDSEFAQRVPEEKLVRLLNVFINELGSGPEDEAREDGGGNLPSIRYVQGMNVLCAPLLYVLPEPDAYHTFCQLIVRHCPNYMAPQLKGVEKGCALVDKCLQTVGHWRLNEWRDGGLTAAVCFGCEAGPGAVPAFVHARHHGQDIRAAADLELVCVCAAAARAATSLGCGTPSL